MKSSRPSARAAWARCDAAVKVRPAAFAQDHERVTRFKREARVLASLNHPNIAAIYGLEESGGPGMPDPYDANDGDAAPPAHQRGLDDSLALASVAGMMGRVMREGCSGSW